jgi:hypothetical protein
MGIQISNAESLPAVTYDKIHMTKLEIIQPTFELDNQQPIYQVIIHYRHYGVTAGKRYYKNEDIQRISIDDFIVLALTDAQAGDTTLLSALQSIEVAVASIIGDQTGIQTTVI